MQALETERPPPDDDEEEGLIQGQAGGYRGISIPSSYLALCATRY